MTDLSLKDAISSMVRSLDATSDQVWQGIIYKASCGRLILRGHNSENIETLAEPRWFQFSRFDISQPTILTFDQDRARATRSTYEISIKEYTNPALSASPPSTLSRFSLPPPRLLSPMLNSSQFEDLWSGANYVVDYPEWSLGNVLSWITFRNPMLLCEFPGRLACLGYRRYNHPASGYVYPEPVVERADNELLLALKEGAITAVCGGTEVKSTRWFGKSSYNLTDGLCFRKSDIIANYPSSGEKDVAKAKFIEWMHQQRAEHGRFPPREPNSNHPERPNYLQYASEHGIHGGLIMEWVKFEHLTERVGAPKK